MQVDIVEAQFPFCWYRGFIYFLDLIGYGYHHSIVVLNIFIHINPGFSVSPFRKPEAVSWDWVYLGMDNGILVVMPYVVVYEDVLNRLVKRVDPKWFTPTNREGITSPPGEDTRQSEMWEWENREQRTDWCRPKEGSAYQLKWSLKPPRPWTELRYWYRALSPLWVDTRSSARLRKTPVLLQRILPAVMLTFNCAKRQKEPNRKTRNMEEI